MIKNPESPENPHIRPNQTFICSVVFIDLVEYTKKPFVEQILIKERFNAHLADAIRDISLNYRIVLDTGDGAAVGFIGDPEDALFVAMSLRDALQDDDSDMAPNLKVRIGINLGPVKILKDINNQMNMIGDGINAAERIMSFCEPGQLLVSRSYYDIVSCLSQEYAQLFHYQGSRADKHIREHDVYSVEHTVSKPGFLYSRTERKQDAVYTEDAAEMEPVKPAAEESYRIYPRQKDQSPLTAKRNRAILIGGAGVAIMAGLFLLSNGEKTPPQNPSVAAPVASPAVNGKQAPAAATTTSAKPVSKQKAPTPEKETPSLKTTAKTDSEPFKKTTKSMSSRADDILFTIVGLKSAGKETTVSIQTRNGSSVTKRVAIYDDAYWWSKSQIADDTGEKYDVNKVVFMQGTEKIAMSFTGTQGIPIEPQKSVIANLIFKKPIKSVRTLVLRPFICHEGNCTEHSMVMNLGKQ